VLLAPRHSNVKAALLYSADLTRANLVRANLSYANLIRANLTKVGLSGADLTRADLKEANLSGALLYSADLSGANLREADLSKAAVEWTIFGNVDLRTVKGLETVTHRGPSTIGTDTISRSGGDIPETFLRGAGLSSTFIDYARSLVQNPIEYYTCFISYSTRDQEFASRLYSDLQAKGVRCWFAPQDMRIGEKFWHRIDESIRLYDKLLVVLSEDSVNSVWVESEVMAALEKEQQNNKLVLFPIKLDEKVMKTNLPWAANIRRTRHIGDFTNWKHYDDYQKALTRLLRDLQPDMAPKKAF
jgi:TIR domain/Pentapeptide repeats (8 copies)